VKREQVNGVELSPEWQEEMNRQVRKLFPTPTKSSSTGAGEHGEGGLNLQTAVKFWPTPCGNKPNGTTREDFSKSLPEMVKLYPTPAAQDAKNSTLPVSQTHRDTVPGALLREGCTGQLTPEFCEWLMGYPIGFSELNASETQSFRKSLKSSRKPSTPKSQKPINPNPF
jgi:hypothetical protein